MPSSPVATTSQSKEHFHVLDGLRGVAAIAVVIFHFMEWIFPDFTQNFIGHGFLAVDFFFCLSGFVMGYAYDNRLSKLGIRSFFTSRFIRLHPLVCAGTLLGIVGLFLDPFADHSESYSSYKLILIVISSLLLIPFPVMKERGYNLFSLNAPAWSLFWEYIANILYATILVKLSKKVLWILILPAAMGLVWVAYHSGNLLGGWSGDTFLDGGVRMAYSFIAGLLIFRSHLIIQNHLGFWGIAFLLTGAFLMPWSSHIWLVELLIVLFYFPLLISLGAGTKTSTFSQMIATFLGKISYPLYMTHYAGIWWFGNYYITQKPSTDTLFWIISIGTTGMLIFAWLVMTFYDIPLRKYLKIKTTS